MKRIAILASGSGTNAENIVRHFAQSTTVEVAAVITNRRAATVVDRLRPLGIEVEYYPKQEWQHPAAVARRLTEAGVDLVVLAGFLAVVRDPLLTAFAGRIINIHPSLLPAFKGAHAVEDAVAYGVKVYGITIHWVNADLDGGKIIAQRAFEYDGDDPEEVHRIGQKIEHALYVETIDKLMKQI